MDQWIAFHKPALEFHYPIARLCNKLLNKFYGTRTCKEILLNTPWSDAFRIWTASNEFGTYRRCEQRRFRRACASAQSRQNLRCSLIEIVSQEEPSDRKPDPWPFWMAGHVQLKFVMMECSKTQIRLTGLICTLHTFPVTDKLYAWCGCNNVQACVEKKQKKKKNDFVDYMLKRRSVIKKKTSLAMYLLY